MLHRSIVTVLGMMVALVMLTAVARESGETVMIEVPKGKAKAGREVFIAMGCTTCHRVAGEKGFPDPVSPTPGPTLGSQQGRQTEAWLSMAVYAPSHEIRATVRGPHKEGQSPMPDFTTSVTVRQFVDLIAYLRSLR